MCEKISGRALDERGPNMGSRDWCVNGQRSACYFYLAIATKDGDFCKLVKGILTVPSNQSGISKSECREIIRKNDAFYASIKNSGNFQTKVHDLPSYAEPYSPGNLRPANEDEMITQMVAVEDKIPALCKKLSPNSHAETAATLYSDMVYRVVVRNSCFSAIALNTRDPGLCGNIVPAESSMSDIKYISRKNCEDGIRFFYSRQQYAHKLWPAILLQDERLRPHFTKAGVRQTIPHRSKCARLECFLSPSHVLILPAGETGVSQAGGSPSVLRVMTALRLEAVPDSRWLSLVTSLPATCLPAA